jgi:hypothetical protein
MPGSFRFWTLVVAGVCAGCGPRHADPRVELALRTREAAQRLQAIGPRLTASGLSADATVASLATVQDAIRALPPPAPPTAPETPAVTRPPLHLAADWSWGAAAEVQAVRLRIRGHGREIDDNGPALVGLALGARRLERWDAHSGWRWGAELALARQPREDGQHLDLVSLRPVIEVVVATGAHSHLSLRPMLEFLQPFIRLGSGAGSLDQANAGLGLGGRLGWSDADWEYAIGWRRWSFTANGGDITYRIDGEGPEVAVQWRF